MNGIAIYDKQGNKQEILPFDKVVPAKEMSPSAYAMVIRTLMQNWRQGTVRCKGRSDVSFSGKKPWKQKGTGRARAGSLSSPLWRKGGVIHGPQPRERRLKVTQQQRTLVMHNIFNELLAAGKIYCVDFDRQNEAPSTKEAFSLLHTLGLSNKKVIVFLSMGDEVLYASFRGLPNVNILYFDQPNAFDLTSGEWIFLKKDVEHFKRMVAQWN